MTSVSTAEDFVREHSIRDEMVLELLVAVEKSKKYKTVMEALSVVVIKIITASVPPERHLEMVQEFCSALEDVLGMIKQRRGPSSN